MNECPVCGSPDVYEEYLDPYNGIHMMHCNECDVSFGVEVGSEEAE